MKNAFKTLIFSFAFLFISLFSSAQMDKKDLEFGCNKISSKTHSHFNLVHNNNIDKFAMKADFSLEYRDNVLVIHNGLNEIHIAYDSIKYVSVGKPDRAHAELKAQWFIVF